MTNIGKGITGGLVLALLSVGTFSLVKGTEMASERQARSELREVIDTPEERVRLATMLENQPETWYVLNKLKKQYPSLKNSDQNRIVYELDQLRNYDLGKMNQDDYNVHVAARDF
ncbi:MAG: hypothetical protein Q7S56_01765 [Nanoarchaeota archaeon]|nr:hypothetical protein [Nanoarchaeota archaeon]